MSNLLSRYGVWLGFALLLLVAPWLFTSNLSQTMLSQMGIAIIACLSYNLLLGQGGMLSFGHAVYSGMGSYFAIHALNAIGAGSLHIPVVMLPLVGGMGSLSGAFLASLVIGIVQTFAVAIDYSLLQLFKDMGVVLSADWQNNSFIKLTVSQVAPILPYLMLVLILIFRPRGLLGKRDT